MTTNGFDTTDLPIVRRAALALAMHLLIEDERGLVLLNGADDADRARLETRFWICFDGDTAEGVATLVRLWSLVDVFQSRRLRQMFLERGFALIPAAVKVAAASRLNLDWGFNPQRFVTALSVRPATAEVHRLQPAPAAAELAMAA